MSPVEQQCCVPRGCVVGEGYSPPVQQIQGDLRESGSLLQHFAHRYFLSRPFQAHRVRANDKMPKAGKGCVPGAPSR